MDSNEAMKKSMMDSLEAHRKFLSTIKDSVGKLPDKVVIDYLLNDVEKGIKYHDCYVTTALSLCDIMHTIGDEMHRQTSLLAETKQRIMKEQGISEEDLNIEEHSDLQSLIFSIDAIKEIYIKAGSLVENLIAKHQRE